jgi:allantoin racemase
MRKIAFLSGGYGPLSPEHKRRHKILLSAANPGTKIDMYGGKGSMETRVGEYKAPEKKGRHSIESVYDEYLSVPSSVKKSIEAEQEGYDAIITSCGNDPGLDVHREAVKIPVIGPGISGMHICSLIGHRFCRLATHRLGRHRVGLLPFEAHNGLMKWVSTRDIGMTVLEVRDNQEKLVEACIKQGRLAIKEDHVDALTWSCSSMSFTPNLEQLLMEALKIPVVNPMKSAVRLAELCIDFGLAQSKLTYPTPKSLLT